MIFPIGPKDKWESDLQRLSRAALVEVVVEMQWRLQLCSGSFDREQMTELLDRGKKYGRWANDHALHQRFMADPEAAIDRSIRRLKAAKAAARRKKRRAA